MDSRERQNWVRVVDALAKAGKTDCLFYKRAVVIASGKPDPLA